MKKTLVLVADFINEIAHKDGKLAEKNYPRIKTMGTIAKVNKLIKWARDNSVTVAHVIVGFDDEHLPPSNSPMMKNALKYGVLKLGTWSTEILDEIDVKDSDPIIVKQAISAFYNTKLADLLKKNNIERLVICGVSTAFVVQSTVRDAHDRNFEVIVISDASNAGSESEHNSSLAVMERLASVLSVDEFINSN